MIKEKTKKALLLGAIAVSALSLSACTEKTDEDNNDNECYAQCEEWGGEVDVCKENCDASEDADSVWNESDEDVAETNDTTFDSWEGMPLAVPEFMGGDFVTGVKGMGSWIVDYENVTEEDTMTDYVSDLEAYDWTASYMDVTNMITGSKEGYTISTSYDADYGTMQIIVRESAE